MPTMIEVALEYLERGYSIIPIGTNKKAKVKWKEYQSRRPTAAEVRQWWGQWPDANIAVITGAISGIVVVDIDHRSGGSLEHDIHQNAQTGTMVRTPNGVHLYYDHPGAGERVRNSVDQSIGTDVRGDGGIALLPPSHNSDGEVYEWISIGGTLPPMPRWVTERDAPNQESLKPSESVGQFERPPWIEKAVSEGPVPGTRNQTIASLAGYLAGRGVEIDIGVEFMRAWNANGNGVDDEELLKTVRSIYDAEAAKPKEPELTIRLVDDVAEEKASKDGEPKPEAVKIHKPGAFDLTPFPTYMEKHAGEDEWLFEGWLPDQTIAMLVAAPGSCKTWVEFDMAVCIAGGGKFMGRVVPNRVGPVIIIQQEDGPKQIQNRIATIQAVRAGLQKPKMTASTISIDIPDDLPMYFHEDARLRFADAQAMDELERKIAILKPVAVFIDPLYSAASAENNMAEAPMQMIRLKQMRQKYGCSFIFVHHRVKGGKYGREGAWGSQLLNGYLETGYQMYKLSDGRVIVDRHTKADGDLDTLIVEFEISTKNDWAYSQSIKTITSERAKALVEADNEGRLGDEPSKSTRRPAQRGEPGPPQKADDGIYQYLSSGVGREHARSPSLIGKEINATPAQVLRGLQRLEGAGLVFKNGNGWSAAIKFHLKD